MHLAIVLVLVKDFYFPLILVYSDQNIKDENMAATKLTLVVDETRS